MKINENRWPDTIQLDSEHHFTGYVPVKWDSLQKFCGRQEARKATQKGNKE